MATKNTKVTNSIKSILGGLIGMDFCLDCGKHVKHTYKYTNKDGDDEFCLRCTCGLSWHMANHVGM